jgi:hypothetical protein
MDTSERPPLACQRCAARLHPGRGEFYLVKIQAVADPSPPVILREELVQDPSKEIQRLLAQVRSLSEQELIDQVYRREILYLCAGCYREWIENPVRG